MSISLASWAMGLDVGSVAAKGVLLRDGEWVARAMIATGWDPAEAGRRLRAELTDSGGMDLELPRVVATGYGRNAVEANGRVTEISCHALGARRLFGDGVRTILDIGGQDSKVIALDRSGNVANFLMNDKCAAGTGRFLQNMAVMLGCSLSDFSSLSEDLEPHGISSMCTVFAESEVVGLLARGVDKNALALGLLDAVASRAEGMMRRLGLQPEVVFTGGVSQSRNLRALLEKRLNLPVRVSEDSQYAGALGAALLATRKTTRRRRRDEDAPK